MIEYTKATLGNIIQEIVLRSGKKVKPEQYDWETMRRQINRSIRYVVYLTLPFKKWAYINNVEIIHKQNLPRDFAGVNRVLLSGNGEPPYVEARRVDIKEYFDINYWRKSNEWARASVTDPAYVLWGIQDANNDSRLSILLLPNTDYETGIVPHGYWYNRYDMSGLLSYYAYPPELVNDTDIVSIPYEYFNLIVLDATNRIISINGDTEVMATNMKRIIEMKKSIVENYQAKTYTDKRELDSFVEPVIPIVSPTKTEGEAPTQLI